MRIDDLHPGQRQTFARANCRSAKGLATRIGCAVPLLLQIMRRLQHTDVQRIREHHCGARSASLRHWSMIIFTSQLLQLAERRRRVRHARDHHHVDRAGEAVERL